MTPRTLACVALALGLHASLATAHERCGDARPYDGVVNIGDAVFVLRLAVGLEVPIAQDLAYLDVAPVAGIDETTVPPTLTLAPDGVIDIADAVLVLRKAVELVAIERCLPEARRIPTVHGPAPDRACPGGVVRVGISDPDSMGFGAVLFDGRPAELVREDVDERGATRWLRIPDVPVIPPEGVAMVMTLERGLGEGRFTVLPPCDAAPSLIGISPASGSPFGATLVQLIGDGLQCASDVVLVGNVTGQREDAWVMFAPADAGILVLPFRVGSDVPQAFDVVVTTPCGTSTLPAAFRFD